VRAAGWQRESEGVRVLIVRLGAMGDVLHAMPAVTALREAFPRWHLGWAIEPRWAPLLRASTAAEPRTAQMPLVDYVHTAHARGWARAPLSPATWAEIARVRRELQDARYDLTIDLQGAVRSAWLGRMARARLVGEARPREAPARWLFAEGVSTHAAHVIEQAAEVAEGALDCTLPRPLPPPWLPRSIAAEQWAEEQAGGAAIALIHPGAGWGAKRWPPERYGRLARDLESRLGMRALVNAGPGEEEIARAVVEASAGAARIMATSLDQLIALTRRAALAVGGDTGPLHLASALGTPVVGIFGPTDPARNGPYGGAFRVLRHPESQRDHTRRSQPEAGLLTITEAEVLQMAEELLPAAGRTV
jgi:heptosyltransferase-1